MFISVVICHTPRSHLSPVFSCVKFVKSSYPSFLAVCKCIVGRYQGISQPCRANPVGVVCFLIVLIASSCAPQPYVLFSNKRNMSTPNRIKVTFVYLLAMFIAQRLEGPCLQLRQIIQIKQNIVNNPGKNKQKLTVVLPGNMPFKIPKSYVLLHPLGGIHVF